MMPTENENSSNILTLETTAIQHMEPNNIDKERNEEMSTPTTNGHNDSGSGNSGSSRKTSITSPDPTAYVAKARITRPTPPPPSYNPMQFVQIKPCNLYQTAQQQLKKVEEVKKIKEIKKEEPEDWQNNLDNWKSSRRKRVEHIIDRVVEVKKLELEEHDRCRRKSKTFSEMMEERGERGVRVGRTKLASLAVYNEDETNDLSDLGIGTSSASGKSSLSDDYDNNSVVSDNTDMERVLVDNSHHPQNSTIREYVSSPGYDTSSSTAPTSSPDPCEYTYEGAIQDYKQRVSKATSGSSTAFKLINNKNQTKTTSKESTPESMHIDDLSSFDLYPARRGSKIEERLIGFEVSSSSDSQDLIEKNKIDVPKVDISKRKEIFELNPMATTNSKSEQKLHGDCNGVPRITLRDHFKLNESAVVKTNSEMKRLSGDMTSIRERLLSLEQQKKPIVNTTNDVSKSMTSSVVDVPVLPLKERLSSLQNAATKEEVKKSPIVLVDARQLEIMKDEEERNAKQRLKQMDLVTNAKKIMTTAVTTPISTQSLHTSNQIESLTDKKSVADQTKSIEADRDDSGIQTSDDVEEERNNYKQLQQPNQEQQLNEAIAALAIEEKQLEQAANVVNQIEAEFEEFSNVASLKTTPVATSTSTNNEQPCEIMEVSVSPTNDSLNKYSNVCRRSLNCVDNLAGRFDLDNKKINVSIDNKVSGNINETTGSSRSAAVDCHLNRKPSNEMIHARNLLSMFKETFKNDFEEDNKECNILASRGSNVESDPITMHNIMAPQTSQMLSTEPTTLESTSQNCQTITKTYEDNCNKLKKNTAKYFGLPPPITRPKPVLNPRLVESCAIGPTGKPPMTPKSTRPPRHPPPPSPPTPSAPTPSTPTPSTPMSSRDGNVTPKAENPFSINGRVEIFNSKSVKIESDPSPKPLSPIAVTKKSNFAQFGQGNTNKTEQEQKCSNDSNWIHLQQQRQALKPNNEAWNNSSQKSVITPIHKTEIIQSPPQALQSTQSQPQAQPDIIVCASPVTIINPEELPKPNTVKALKNCFTSSNRNDVISPKPIRRKQIMEASSSQTEIDQRMKIVNLSENPNNADVIDKEFSSLTSPRSSSSTSSLSPEMQTLHETKAIIHDPPKSRTQSISDSRDEVPFQPTVNPSKIPPLILCSPNESTLYKLASSAPQSPCSPSLPLQKLSPTAVDLCTSFFSQSASPPIGSVEAKTPPSFNRQQTVEEIMCEKIDARKLPHNQLPGTGCYDITVGQIENCDNQNNPQTSLPASTSDSEKKINSKPNSPIVAARAAHSKALIETCEKIIAEERQARSQISASLPRTSTSQKSSSMTGCKSKIPLPRTCCISASDSITTADLETHEEQKDEKIISSPTAIGRQHVVETQIKVVTKTPPASPKMSNKKHCNNNDSVNKSNNNNNVNSKTKTKNIFDFLRKNFSHSESAGPVLKSSELSGTAREETMAVKDGGDVLKTDKIITVDNSKFYIACEEEETTPPPLPQSPVPTKNLADDILEESAIDFSLKEEINALLDEEINKLNLETKLSESRDKVKVNYQDQ